MENDNNRDCCSAEELEQSVNMVIAALNLRYSVWRANAIREGILDDILTAMDKTHEEAITYVEGMLLSPKSSEPNYAV
jgi:hypothetical protein